MSLRINKTVTVAALDADGIAASQTLDAAGYLTLASASVDTNNQMVTLTSTADLSGLTYTVTGTVPGDPGHTMSVSVAGPNNETVEVDYFGTVTSIYCSGDMNTDEVSAGWTDKGVSQAWPCDVRQTPFAIGFGCVIEDGTPAFSVQHTFSSVYGTDVDPTTWEWFTNSSVSAETTNTDGNYAFPVSAIRLYVNGAGSVSFRGYQAVQG